MNAFVTLFIVFLLVLFPMFGVGAAHLTGLFGVAIPYVAVGVFLVGFIYKIYDWAKIPVPFRIPTTGGQQKTLDWIPCNPIDNPYTVQNTWLRMLGEVFLFRSLFRNTTTQVFYAPGEEPKVAYFSNKVLWLAAIAFHYSFFVIFIRHFRFFTDPVPFFVNGIEQVDGLVQMLQPNIYLTDLFLVAGVGYLLFRRLFTPQIRYMSMAQDYFPLFLILGIAFSGIYMRYIARADIATIKQFTMSLATFHPHVPDGMPIVFFVHLFLICALLVYFPFSKLMHLGGLFMSPTRNLANNSRAVHHENPWNPKVKWHSYEDYENDFREPMAEAGLPLDKPLEDA